MSLQHTNISTTSSTSTARSRSLRVPAKPSLTAPQPVPQPVPADTSTQIPSSTSNPALFLTNLRLLDLDQEPDWPGITLATFSTKDAAGGQKKRIQSVEWALYQLFTLWDYNETQNKLRPFFPPLDQVQSINLRAALLRALEQAKKNGVLGRDAVLRKTMLDECKGERLEEVLAVFSSAVLKKLVAERALNSGPEYRPTISEKLALENWGYSGDRTELNALLLAYKASLSSLLAKKNTERAKYRDFEQLLASKEQALSQRKEKAKAESERSVAETSERTRKEVNKIIKTNWTGNDQWIDSLLYNDTNPRKGGLLGSRFDDVWAGVEQGKVCDLEDENTGLLEQLDSRVQMQRSRLEKWDNFRKEMFSNMPPPPTIETRRTTKPKNVGLRFTAHQELNIDKIRVKDKLPLKGAPAQYHTIVSNMKAELGTTGKHKIPDFSGLLGGSNRSLGVGAASYATKPEEPAEAISDISEWEDEPEEAPRIEKPLQATSRNRYRLVPPKASTEAQGRTHVPKASSLDVSFSRNKKVFPDLSPNFRPKPSEQPSFSPEPSPIKAVPETQESPKLDGIPQIITSHSIVASPEVSPSPSPSDKMMESLSPPPASVSPTQAMANEILKSMSNASPSPVKKPRHTLSLAERTRLSMTRAHPFEKEDEGSPPSPTKPTPAQSSSDNNTNHLPENDEYEDLVARTRRSMVGFEAARQKAQLERRRSERKSKMIQRKGEQFPKLEEDNVDNSIVEELIDRGQEDYEAVFRSRPRVQTSPLPSPSKMWNAE
ncbi:HAUS augmin-like complex subunit 6 N-terminus-domain-containing protein [Daldinia caldariorum]|uniref:HAUS augmin-like complex subunit 6 N-terminus-domain-containing protein n=1 Tax=Daldinia caldariorum TaxID=326644 RepID=UPI002008E3BA|nr:HAUS augmin-like complex subunit 6 N-terminus-domain-containing protein [Daldinia caldariorum]KAI1470527.1 HAUS augmin-like complex subunit 6 N-terminus-domain-containing protein [Daldinia caldariorum]